jgi:nicotinate-nucleotide adenylyltransferase
MQIGLFFGSFNPIHIGHLAIASYAAQFGELDQVWFVVSPHNPFKEKRSLLKAHHRLAMVRAAIDDISYLSVSDIELALPQPSYTINTLAHLEEKYPQHQFSLLIGSDNLAGFPKWKNHELILERHQLLVYPRVGSEPSILLKHPHVQEISAPQVEISSTFIRTSIFEGKDVRCFMPERAWLYLEKMNFYKP